MSLLFIYISLLLPIFQKGHKKTKKQQVIYSYILYPRTYLSSLPAIWDVRILYLFTYVPIEACLSLSDWCNAVNWLEFTMGLSWLSLYALYLHINLSIVSINLSITSIYTQFNTSLYIYININLSIVSINLSITSICTQFNTSLLIYIHINLSIVSIIYL